MSGHMRLDFMYEEKHYYERSELLICKVHQFGLNLGSGLSKTVHVNQSEYHFGTSLIHFGVVIFGDSLVLYSVIL